MGRENYPGAVENPSYDVDRVWTVPNALSLLRLLGVPLFLWLVLGPADDGWALPCSWSAASPTGSTAYLARRWEQMTRVGQLLDPVADRLYILSTLLGLAYRDVVPWWLRRPDRGP